MTSPPLDSTTRLPLASDPLRLIAAIVAAIAAAVLLAILHIETVLAAGLFVAGLYAGARRPDMGLALIALSVPVQRSLLVGFGDTAVTTTKVVLWSTLAGWAWSTLAARRSVMFDKVTFGAALVAGGVALSGWNARDGGLWMGEAYRWFTMVPVCCMAFNVFRRGASPIPFLVASAVGAIVSYGVSVWQVLRSTGPDSFEVRGLMRATGSFGHPNQLAIYFELVAPLMTAIGIFLWKRQPDTPLGQQLLRLRPLWFVAAACSIAGLVFTQSRGGSVGMIAGLATVMLLTWPVLRLRSHVLMAIAGSVMIVGSIVLVLILGEGHLTTDRRAVQVTPANFAVEERIAHWIAGVEMVKDNPFLGVGAGNYDLNFRDQTTTWRFRIGRGHAHNSYIQMLAQSGVIGFAGYAALIAMVGLTIAQALDRASSTVTRSITIGVAGMSAALLVHAIFEYVHVLSLNLQMAVAWGLVSAIAAGGVDTIYRSR